MPDVKIVNFPDTKVAVLEHRGGRCAVLRHVGSDDTLGETVRLLCEEWFPQSGEIRRDFPLFFQRVKNPPEVSENDSIIDVYLPIQRR